MTLIIGIIASVWPELFKPYWALIWSAGAVSIVLIVIGYLLRSVPESDEPAASKVSSNFAGRDNNGKQIVAETVHFYEAGSVPSPASVPQEMPAPIAQASLAPESPPPDTRPRVNLVALPITGQMDDDGFLPDADKSSPLLLLPLRIGCCGMSELRPPRAYAQLSATEGNWASR